MIVAIVELDLHIYEANSLKEKRSVIKSLIERLRSRFNISVGEVGDNDLWNRSKIGISAVANDSKYINGLISRVLKFIDGDSRVEIVCENIEIL